VRRHPVLTPIVLVFVLVLGACGDPAGEPAPTAPQETPGEAPAPGETVTTAAPMVPSPGDQPGGFPTAQCLDIVFAVAEAMSLGAMSAGDPFEVVRSLEAVAAVVPPAVAADVQLLAGAYAAYMTALEDAGVDFEDPAWYASPEAQQQIQAATAAFEASGAIEAAERIGDYIDEVCEG
jgi:hypothetical protein